MGTEPMKISGTQDLEEGEVRKRSFSLTFTCTVKKEKNET